MNNCLSTITALTVIVLLAKAAAVAQPAEPGPLPVQPNIAEQFLKGYKFTHGEACTMMKNNDPGVIKRDACGRWYCGRKNFQDITELRPNFSTEMGCEWKIVDRHCLCQHPSGKVISPFPKKN